jgi:hypothetical protein
MHLTKIKRPDADISFELEFQKARERIPSTRASFADKKVALVNDQWQVGGTLFEAAPLTNEQRDWVDQLEAVTTMMQLEVFTRADMQLAWSDITERAARMRIEILLTSNILSRVEGEQFLYLWARKLPEV